MDSVTGFSILLLVVVILGIGLGVGGSILVAILMQHRRRIRIPIPVPCPVWDKTELEQHGYVVIDVYDDSVPLRTAGASRRSRTPSIARYVSRTVKVRHQSTGHIMLVRMACPL
jgi:hypothetical protein